MWVYFCLLVFVILGYGAAFIMARKTKQPKVTVVQQAPNIDIEDLIVRVAKAVAEEIVDKLPQAQVIYHDRRKNRIGIEMDIDKVIPIAIDATAVDTNLEGMTKEEEVVDKDLEKSKSKLAGILKKKE